MEHQKIINLLDNTRNQSSKFRTKNYVEITYNVCRIYTSNDQITFKNTMLKSSIFGYSDSYIFVKGTIEVSVSTAAATNNKNEN